MNLSIDPIRTAVAPYIAGIKVGAIVLAASVLFFGGCSVGKRMDQAEHDAAIAHMNDELSEADEALAAADVALQAQNRDNAKRIAEAERTAKAAGMAEGYADAMRTRGDKAAEAYRRGLRDAAHKSPDCAALLKSDVLEVCGL